MSFKRDFELEVFFSKWEFKVKYNLCASDIQSFSMKELLSMANSETLTKFESLHLGYTETMGNPNLREKIAKNYKERKPDNIICFTGAEEGIYCAMHAILNKDDHAIIFYPNYQSSETIPMSICEVTGIALDPDNNWNIDIDIVKKSIKPNTRLISINFPNNPTGKIIDKSSFNELVNICDKNGIYLFSDEVYRLIERDREKRLPQAFDVYDKGISLNVLSKSYGFAGLRMGWIAAKEKKLLKKMERIKHYLSICNSAPSELLSEIVLDNKREILERNRELVSKNIELLDTFFRKHKDIFGWKIPDGGAIGFPEYKGDKSCEEFCSHLLEKTGILLLPGIYFRSEVGATCRNNFRIGYGRDFTKEALGVFDNYLNSEN